MAGSFNKFICVGRLTRDPELRALSSGANVAKFTVAVDRRGRGTNRENRETDFFDVTAWDRLAETCNTYLKKGMLVLIEGRIQIRSYEDRDGVKRKAVDLIANDMQMLDRPGSGASGDEAYRDDAYRAPSNGGGVPADEMDDEIPF
ncbi:MAG TPA: single-stranded DNA-binding protein [Candidatus Dormibacteraeota bacterium]|nr:single-stranded DNA-binding protein [Candidatus Dormibacteraeota bacterium]